MTSKFLKTGYLKIIFGLLALGVLGWYIVSNWQQFQSLQLTYPLFIVPAIAAYVANIYCMGRVVDQAVQPHGVTLTRRETFGLSAITRFFKQITPGYVGFAVRAIYLKKRYKLSYTKFSTSLIVSTILQLITTGVLTIALFFFTTNQSTSGTNAIITIVVILGIFLLLLYTPLGWMVKLGEAIYKRFPKKIVERLLEAILQYQYLRKHPALFSRSALWTILTLLATAAMIACLYYAFGFNIGFHAFIFIACFASWANIFSITPADIGVREGLMVLGAQLMGIPIPLTIAVSILLRLVMLIPDTLLSIYFAPLLFKTSLFKLSAADRSQ